jgi:hypothetical protein
MSAILQRDARNARVYGHIFALTGTGESLTCEVMSHHFDFLSMREEFGADGPGERMPGRTHCIGKNLRAPRAARGAPLSRSLMGGTSTNIRKPNGAMDERPRATESSERSSASAIRAGSLCAG